MNDESRKKDKEEDQSEQPEKADQAGKSGQIDDGGEKKDPDPQWVAELDSYPLRNKEDDPRWAVRIVWIWTGIALASFTFILVMLVLGAIYD